MKKIGILLALLLLATFTLSQCQKYSTDTNGNYIPDTNGNITLCPETDLNSIRTTLNQKINDYNKLQTDTNQIIEDYNAMHTREQKAIDKYNETLSNYSNLSQKIDDTKTTITQKTQELQGKLDSTSQDINQAIKQDLPQQVQQTLQPAIDKATETRDKVQSLSDKQENDKNQLITQMQNNQQETTILIALLFIAILASLTLMWFLTQKKPKNKQPEPEEPQEKMIMIEKPIQQPTKPKNYMKEPKKPEIRQEIGIIHEETESLMPTDQEVHRTVESIKQSMDTKQKSIKENPIPQRETKEIPEKFDDLKKIAEDMSNNA